MKDAAEKAYKKMQSVEQYQNELSSICTFKPSINPISGNNDEILSNNDIYKYQKDIVSRQYLMSDIHKDKMEKKIAQMIKEENVTFNPKVDQISNFLMEADAERSNETLDQKIERLSKKV